MPGAVHRQFRLQPVRPDRSIARAAVCGPEDRAALAARCSDARYSRRRAGGLQCRGRFHTAARQRARHASGCEQAGG
eukprot:4652795-Prymnesium_polylepis.1